jgi:hypothetical protein
MALRFLLDEHLRGPFWWAIQRHNSRSIDQIDSIAGFNVKIIHLNANGHFEVFHSKSFPDQRSMP